MRYYILRSHSWSYLRYLSGNDDVRQFMTGGSSPASLAPSPRGLVRRRREDELTTVGTRIKLMMMMNLALLLRKLRLTADT